MKNDQTGYRRPPSQHRFSPGVSGNPAGRPKGRRSFLAELTEELNEKVGEVTKQRKIIQALVEDAMQGEARAVASLLGLAVRASAVSEPEFEDDPPEDRAIVERFAQSQPSATRPHKSGGEP